MTPGRLLWSLRLVIVALLAAGALGLGAVDNGGRPAGAARVGDGGAATDEAGRAAPANPPAVITYVPPGTSPLAPTPSSSSARGASASPGLSGYHEMQRKGADFPFEMTLSSACVTRGSVLTVTVKTRPISSMAGAAQFADGDAHGLLTVSSAGPDGSWVWPVTIPQKAPNGVARMLVTANDRAPGSNDDGASTNGEGVAASHEFEVKDGCT